MGREAPSHGLGRSLEGVRATNSWDCLPQLWSKAGVLWLPKGNLDVWEGGRNVEAPDPQTCLEVGGLLLFPEPRDEERCE